VGRQVGECRTEVKDMTKHLKLTTRVVPVFQVANHKRLRGGVVFLEAIPKSPAGKILRRELRDLAKVDDQHKSSAFNSTQQKITKL
jgi:acyl-coenzyme A synthetase/AMP-(fatty) acid ligase